MTQFCRAADGPLPRHIMGARAVAAELPRFIEEIY